MQSVEDKILTSLKKSGRGVAFTPTRFAHYGSAAAVQKAIERLYTNQKTYEKLSTFQKELYKSNTAKQLSLFDWIGAVNE